MDSRGVNPHILRWFRWYARRYLRRNFHAVRLVRGAGLSSLTGWPVIVCMNHPSWWDPLTALTLSAECMPDRTHFAPIEAAALSKYRFFEKIGFFGIEPGTARGAAAFLRRGGQILRESRNALWVTAQGHFTDARIRPPELRRGIAHLVRRLPRVAVLPLAVEYPFWDERYPEVLAMWGDPLFIEDGASRTSAEWTASFAAALSAVQDRLAELALGRDPAPFATLVSGSAGIGGTYDLWRSLKARLRGERFHRAHRSEVL